MRRMRDLNFVQTIAIAVPVLAAAFGIYYLVRHHHPQQAIAVKETPKASRSIASVPGDKDNAHAWRDKDDEVESRPTEDAEAETVAQSPRKPASDQAPSVALEGASNDAAAVGKDCASIEYRGEGPKLTKVTKGDWSAVMDQFHAAKHELLSWLEKRKHDLPESISTVMERQVRNLKIQRPPAAEEPDLAWRGIGVYSQSAQNDPILRIGGGFVKLSLKNPARARFEMARLVAQAWAPCELQRLSAKDETWLPLLKCLGMSESQGCGEGTFSESGWAVSTTLAAAVSAPGCQIPAFKLPEFAQCVKQIPFAQGKTDKKYAVNASEGGR